MPLFGWAKPTPVGAHNFKRLARGHVLVAGAGPLSNLLLAVLFTAALFVVRRSALRDMEPVMGLLNTGVWINVLLAFFNMVPLPPLDGSWVASWGLPRSFSAAYDRVVQPYGQWILLALFATGILSRALAPCRQPLLQLPLQAHLLMSDGTPPSPMNKPRILSGMRPTGALHLGNYLGALENWVAPAGPLRLLLLDRGLALADHRLRRPLGDPRERDRGGHRLAGRRARPRRGRPSSSRAWCPQHAELHLLLSMIVPVPWLERVPTYKEQQQNIQGKDLSTYGFLGYPLLQTADIIVYKADAVPVGEDQAPHIEIAREIVRRFNNLYGEVFPEPQTLLTEAKRIPGTDGRKMSKSYGNAIYLKDDPETVRQKLKPMLTDPARKRRTDPGDPGICPVFDLHKAFSPPETREWAAAGCRTAGIGCLDCKAKLAEHLLERLKGVHARRPEFVKRPDTVWDVLLEGSKKAREVAEATMEAVRGAMKIRYPRS